MPSLLFKITNAGLIGAQNALNTGIRVRLTSFKLGSGYNYIPNGTEVGLAGTTLYEDSITSYKNMPDGSLVLVCSVDVQAGPFDFGEIGIYTDTGALFAIATLPQRQTKYTSLGSNINSTFTFNCHMRLAQSTGIFEISAIDHAASELYVKWRDVKPPLDMPDPRVTRLLITDLDTHGDSAALVQTPDETWSIQSNLICVGPLRTILVSTNTYVEVTTGSWTNMFPGLLSATLAASDTATIVLQMPNCQFREATATLSGSNVRFTFVDPLTTALALTDKISVWCNNFDRMLGVKALNGNYLTVSGNGTRDAGLRYDVDVTALATAIFANVACADVNTMFTRCSITPAPVGSPVGTPVGTPVG